MSFRTRSYTVRRLADLSSDLVAFDPATALDSDPSRIIGELFNRLAGSGSVAQTRNDDQSLESLTELCADARYHLVRHAGSGGQGTVYLARREGADGFQCTIALKFYLPRSSRPREEYEAEMRRIARQAQRSCEVQHDNLVAIRDFIVLGESRGMVMEWIDGVDLDRLLDLRRFTHLSSTVSSEQWKHLNDVILTEGDERCLLKPGVAIAIIQQCLTGLAALHQNGIVHCDVKPSNIMIKRTGNVKIIDMDSSTNLEDGGRYSRLTPYFMAPELFRSEYVTCQADIASLGYTLLELLTGNVLFAGCRTLADLERAKQKLPDQLEEYLPPQVRKDVHLVEMCRRMIAVDPQQRFADAESANFGDNGAASFLRHLVRTDLWADYDREIGDWLEFVLDDHVGSAGNPRIA